MHQIACLCRIRQLAEQAGFERSVALIRVGFSFRNAPDEALGFPASSHVKDDALA
jgi:hypothetical protein